VFLLVTAYPGCHGPRAVKQLCLCACVRACMRVCVCVFLLSTVDDDVDDIATVTVMLTRIMLYSNQRHSSAAASVVHWRPPAACSMTLAFDLCPLSFYCSFSSAV